ncbi:MAG: hypothetical protein ACM3S2_20165 [Ignavibacteriales bacterium]
MNVVLLIGYVSSFIWALPPFRQYKGNFFYYFLFVALSDPLVMALRSSLRIVPSNMYFVLTLFSAFVSIISINKKIKWEIVLPVLAAVLAFGFSIPNRDISYIMCVLIVLILYYSIRHIAFFAAKKEYVSLFHFLFLIYNASLLIKFINAMVDSYMGAAYFYSTTIFEIILGILFCFFREEDKRLAFNLSKHKFKEL